MKKRGKNWFQRKRAEGVLYKGKNTARKATEIINRDRIAKNRVLSLVYQRLQRFSIYTSARYIYPPYIYLRKVYIEVKAGEKTMARTKRYIVSGNTGEITGELLEGDRILRKNSMLAIQDKMRMSYGEFAILNTEELKLLLEELDKYETAALFSMLPYVRYSSCMLAYKNGNSIGTEDMPKIFGLGRNKTYQVLDTLLSKDILYKGKNSREVQYFINPWIIYKGKFINRVLQDMFQNYRIRSKGGVKWKNLEET